MFKTYSIKLKEIEKKWILIDATNLVVGRLAVVIANTLRGKNKVTFTPHMDCGDHVIVINTDKMILTGNKLTKEGKIYYRHTGHPGGIKEISAAQAMAYGKSDFVLTKAVERMISRSKLGRAQMKHLYVYKDADHKHAAQNPGFLDVAALNSKNVRK
jgi:large subunit ribosomal protein L13